MMKKKKLNLTTSLFELNIWDIISLIISMIIGGCYLYTNHWV